MHTTCLHASLSRTLSSASALAATSTSDFKGVRLRVQRDPGRRDVRPFAFPILLKDYCPLIPDKTLAAHTPHPYRESARSRKPSTYPLRPPVNTRSPARKARIPLSYVFVRPTARSYVAIVDGPLQLISRANRPDKNHAHGCTRAPRGRREAWASRVGRRFSRQRGEKRVDEKDVSFNVIICRAMSARSAKRIFAPRF